MPTVLCRVVGSAVTDAVALGKGPVQQDELRIMLAQSLEQARGPLGYATLYLNAGGTSTPPRVITRRRATRRDGRIPWWCRYGLNAWKARRSPLLPSAG